MKYLVLGAGGMVGHAVTYYLREAGHNVAAQARRRMRYVNYNFDLYETRQLDNALRGGYDAIINCAGILCESAESTASIADAIYINSYLPHYIAARVAKTGSQFIQISTDCVFSGARGRYGEPDVQDARTFYGRTKALGEVNCENCLTIRTSIVGPDINPNGIGLFNWFMAQNGRINGYQRAIWSGVTSLELAKAIEAASEQKICGIYHICANSAISKLYLLRLFKKSMMREVDIVPESGFVSDKSLRCTRNDLNYIVPPYEAMVESMAEWIGSHAELYPHYRRL